MNRRGVFGWPLRRRILAATRFGYWLVGTAVLSHLAVIVGINMQLSRAGFAPLRGLIGAEVSAWLGLTGLSYAALGFVDRQLPETDRVFL